VPVTFVSGNLDVHGIIRARAYTQFSDIRLKTNVCDIVDAIDIVSKLKGQTYEWKKEFVDAEFNEGNKVIGLIAQEVQKILPEVVQQDPKTGFLSVSYAEILPVLLEAFNQFMKEYNNEKQDIQNQIEILRNQLDQLTREIHTPETEQSLQEINGLIEKTCILSRELVKSQTSQYHVIEENSLKQLEPTKKFSNSLFIRKNFYFGMGTLMVLFIACIFIGVALILSSEYQRYTNFSNSGTTLPIQDSLVNSTEYWSHTDSSSTFYSQGTTGNIFGATTGRRETTGTTRTTGTTGITGTSDKKTKNDIVLHYPTTNFLIGASLLTMGISGFILTLIITLYVFKKSKSSSFQNCIPHL